MSKVNVKEYSLDNFLEEENIAEEVSAIAIKRVVSWQVQEAMSSQKITKKAMAERMHTSRSQLDRLLDPAYTGITLELLSKAARAVGRELKLEFVQGEDR
jgi:antitoxin HicB